MRVKPIWIAAIIVLGLGLLGSASLFFFIEPIHCEDILSSDDVLSADGRKKESWIKDGIRKASREAAKYQKWLDDKTGAHERRWERMKRDSNRGGAGAGLHRQRRHGP